MINSEIKKNSTNFTTDDLFEEDVIKSLKPILIDFWAEWCGPCKQISPILDEIQEEKKEQIKVLKLNIDENPKIPQQFGIRGIPTLMFFNKGELVDSIVGVMPKSSIIDWIENCLNK